MHQVPKRATEVLHPAPVTGEWLCNTPYKLAHCLSETKSQPKKTVYHMVKALSWNLGGLRLTLDP